MKTPQAMGTVNTPFAYRTPADRGSADRYYGRGCNPHKIVNNVRWDGDDLTEEERAEYTKAWNEETDRKQWD